MPQWNLTIKLSHVFHDDSYTVEEKAQIIADLLKTSGWRSLTGDVGFFDNLVADLEQAETKGYFNDVWEWVYDLADVDRVWIETR